MRARDVSRPTDADLDKAAESVERRSGARRQTKTS
jgi:hypothetical protein